MTLCTLADFHRVDVHFRLTVAVRAADVHHVTIVAGLPCDLGEDSRSGGGTEPVLLGRLARLLLETGLKLPLSVGAFVLVAAHTAAGCECGYNVEIVSIARLKILSTPSPEKGHPSPKVYIAQKHFPHKLTGELHYGVYMAINLQPSFREGLHADLGDCEVSNPCYQSK